MRSYEAMHRDLERQVNGFMDRYAFYAFTVDDAREGLRKFGLTYPDGLKGFARDDTGGFILKERVPELNRILSDFDAEVERCKSDDKWLEDAFAYCIGMHDVGYADEDDYVEPLDYTYAEVQSDPRLKRLFDRAYDRALGIDIEETPENSYYLLCRRTDPTFTARHALREWLSENPDVAEGLAIQYWSEYDPDDEPFDWDAFESIINGMEPMEAFQHGRFSRIHDSDEWIVVDGYGNFQSISDYDLQKRCVALTGESDFGDHVLNGDLEVPPDLAEILSIFPDGSDVTVSRNCKSCSHAVTSANRRPKTAKRSVAKRKAKTAKTKKTGKASKGAESVKKAKKAVRAKDPAKGTKAKTVGKTPKTSAKRKVLR